MVFFIFSSDFFVIIKLIEVWFDILTNKNIISNNVISTYNVCTSKWQAPATFIQWVGRHVMNERWISRWHSNCHGGPSIPISVYSQWTCGLTWVTFSFLFFFLSFSVFASYPSNSQSSHSICFFFLFDLSFFYYYSFEIIYKIIFFSQFYPSMFFMYHIWSSLFWLFFFLIIFLLYFFSISSRNILFHLIFILYLVLILLISIF